MNNNPLDRLKLTINQIKSGDKPISQRQMMADLKYKRESTISDILNGRAALNEKFISRFCMKYNVREEWIEKGEMPMFEPVVVEDPTEDKKASTVGAEATDIPFLIREAIESLKREAAAERDAKHAERDAKEAYKRVAELEREARVSLADLREDLEREREESEIFEVFVIEELSVMQKESPEVLNDRLGSVGARADAVRKSDKNRKANNLNKKMA